MVSKFYFLLALGLFLLPSAFASTCTNFGCTDKPSTVIISNATLITNNTIYINNGTGGGIASALCPAGYALANVTNTTSDCVALAGGSMDYAYVNLNINGNLTSAKAFTMAQYNGNNSAWLSTYNASYDGLLQGNASLWTEAKNKYNASYVNNDTSWNEARANSLYITLLNSSINTMLGSYITTAVSTLTNYFTSLTINNITLQNKTDLYLNLTNWTNSNFLNNANRTDILNFVVTNQIANNTADKLNDTATYVPYIGGNANVNIGNYNFTLNGTTMYSNGTFLCFGGC